MLLKGGEAIMNIKTMEEIVKDVSFITVEGGGFIGILQETELKYAVPSEGFNKASFVKWLQTLNIDETRTITLTKKKEVATNYTLTEMERTLVTNTFNIMKDAKTKALNFTENNIFAQMIKGDEIT